MSVQFRKRVFLDTSERVPCSRTIEDERHATRFAEASVREPNASRVHELRRRGLVTLVLGH
jgi:hypothetical protein